MMDEVDEKRKPFLFIEIQSSDENQPKKRSHRKQNNFEFVLSNVGSQDDDFGAKVQGLNDDEYYCLNERVINEESVDSSKEKGKYWFFKGLK